MAATRRQHKNQKESAWVPPLQRDPGPWSRLVINWMATLAVIMALAAVIGAPEIRNKTCLALPFLFLMLHVSYGTGTVIGLIKMPFWAKGIKDGRN